MAAPEVKVRITGDKGDLDANLAGAARGIGGFVSSALSNLKGLAAAAAAVAFGKFLKDSLEEAINAEQGMRRLGTAVTNAGADFGKFRVPIETTIEQVRRLSVFTDDDLRGAFTNLVLKSGDVQGSLKNLQLVADIAADGQHDLAGASDLVGKAMGGTTTGLNKLGVAGKDANTVIENARGIFRDLAQGEAATLGGRLASLTNAWGEVKEAVGTAILNTGVLQTGTAALTGVMEDLVRWIEANEGAVGAFVAQVGEAIASAGRWVAENTDVIASLGRLTGNILEVTGKVAGFIAKVTAFADRNLIGELLGFSRDEVPKAAKEGWGKATETVATETAKQGAISASAGKRLTKAQVEEEEDRQKKLKAEREKAAKDAEKAEKEFNEKVLAVRKKQSEDTVALLRSVNDAFNSGVTLSRQRTEELGAALDKALGRQIQEATRATSAELERMAVQLERHVESGRMSKAEYDRAQETLRVYRSRLSDMLPDAETLAKYAKNAADENERLKNEAKEAADRIKEGRDKAKEQAENIAAGAEKMAGIARATLDFGQAFGVVDRQAAAVLNSVINIGASIARLGVDPVGGILGIIGGLANVISGIGSSPADRERRALLAKNNQELERLAREIGNFGLGTTGKTFQAATDIFENIEGLRGTVQDPFLKFTPAQLKADILKQFAAKGVSQKDFLELLDQIAPELRGGFEKGDPKALFEIITRIGTALKTTEFGQKNKDDFAEQLKTLESSFEVFGVTDPEQKLKGFKQLLGKFSPLLASALAEGTAEEQIAKLQNLFTQFQKGGLKPGDFGKLSAGETESILKTLIALLRAPGSKEGDEGGALPDDLFGKPAGVGAGVGLGLGAPGLPPTGETGGLTTAAAIGTQIGTQIAGDVTFNIYDATDPRAVAEEVAVVLGQKYSLQLTALGRTI